MRFEYSDTDMVSDVEYPDSIRTDLNPSKRIRSRIQSENIGTIFIPTYITDGLALFLHPTNPINRLSLGAGAGRKSHS
jgi:hypothetical protein